MLNKDTRLLSEHVATNELSNLSTRKILYIRVRIKADAGARYNAVCIVDTHSHYDINNIYIFKSSVAFCRMKYVVLFPLHVRTFCNPLADQYAFSY